MYVFSSIKSLSFLLSSLCLFFYQISVFSSIFSKLFFYHIYVFSSIFSLSFLQSSPCTIIWFQLLFSLSLSLSHCRSKFLPFTHNNFDFHICLCLSFVLKSFFRLSPSSDDFTLFCVHSFKFSRPKSQIFSISLQLPNDQFERIRWTNLTQNELHQNTLCFIEANFELKSQVNSFVTVVTYQSSYKNLRSDKEFQ